VLQKQSLSLEKVGINQKLPHRVKSDLGKVRAPFVAWEDEGKTTYPTVTRRKEEKRCNINILKA
jgi:hypothetical protein